MRHLAIDLGERHTGVAFLDDQTGVPLPLATFHHSSLEECAKRIHALIEERSIDHMVIGLPLLPSGKEGTQAQNVRSWITSNAFAIPVTYMDERYTTPRRNTDGVDAEAACALLCTFHERKKRKRHNNFS